MTMKEPLLLADNLVKNVWGTESWQFSVHPDHPGSAILSDGKTTPLSSIAPRSTLLLKFIDARDNLSVQVHPDNAYAQTHENSSGKCESWLILGPGTLYLGFKTKTDGPAFKKACAAGTEEEVLSYLNAISVKKGDVFHVPPGTVHAIGKGVRLFEIQQSSGITYRVWDWNRGSRPLHLEKAFDVLNFAAFQSQPSDTTRIADPCGFYEAEIIMRETKIGASRDFYVLTVLDGKINLSAGPKEVAEGHSVLVPAGIELKVGARQPFAVVRSWTKAARPSS